MTNREFRIDLDRLNKHFNLFISNIPPLLLQFDNLSKSPNSVQWFTLGMLQRLINSSISLNTLLPKYVENSVFDFGIGILIRPIILDTLIGMNLLRTFKNKIDTNEETQAVIAEVDHFCKGALADGLIQTLKYFSQLESYGFVGKQDLHKMFNDFSQEYPDFLDQINGINTMPKARDPRIVKPNKHFQDLVEDSSFRNIGKNLYELYVIYSKYDHFGFLYFDIINGEKELKNDRIAVSINLFVNHFANLCDLLQRVTPNNRIVDDIYLLSKKYLENEVKDIKRI